MVFIDYNVDYFPPPTIRDFPSWLSKHHVDHVVDRGKVEYCLGQAESGVRTWKTWRKK
ncbi:hypothetical protein A2U01_0077834, partial [Trifolium medium]|nr:hypothetical protein [Trifolium medium]